MRVLHIIRGLGVGGAELFLHRLAEDLRAQGVDQHIVSLMNGRPDDVDFSGSGITVDHVPFEGLLGLPRGLAQLRRIVRHYRPDILQTWMYSANLAGALTRSGLSRPKLIWNIRCGKLSLPLLSSLVVRLNALFASVVPDCIICCGQAARTVHLAQGYPAERTIVINNGFRFAPDRPQFARPVGPLIIGAAGRFDPAKDYSNLLQAFRVLLDTGTDARLRIAGRGCEAANPWFATRLDELKLTESVDLVGQLSDMRAFYRGLDIFCLSSNSEGFPNVLCEAMAEGVPVVSTSVSDARDMVGEGGVVVPVADPAALAAALGGLARLPAAERMAIGARGSAHVRRQYDLSRIARDYLDRYRAVLAESADDHA